MKTMRKCNDDIYQLAKDQALVNNLKKKTLHWPTVDEGLDTAALTSVSLMFLGHLNATTGGSGNNVASVSLFSVSFQ